MKKIGSVDWVNYRLEDTGYQIQKLQRVSTTHGTTTHGLRINVFYFFVVLK